MSNGALSFSFKTLLTLSALAAMSMPVQAGFDWIPGELGLKGAQSSSAADRSAGGYTAIGNNVRRSPEIYIKREKISPRDARAELERTDYDEINAMADALVFEPEIRSAEATPMVMQTHPQHGPVQIVPVRSNYGGSSTVSINSPEITMDAMPSSDHVVRPSAVNRVAPVAPPASVASYDDYRQQNNFVQNPLASQSVAQAPVPLSAPALFAPEPSPPMLVADEPLQPLAPIMKATPKAETKHAMVYIADPSDSVIDLPAPKGLSINPYPQAGLTVPEAVRPQTQQPKAQPPAINNAPVIAGFGSDLPLVIALQQVIPPSYRYQFSSNVELGQTTSWSGGKSWDGVLMDMLAPLGLGARIDGQTVYIGKLASRV